MATIIQDTKSGREYRFEGELVASSSSRKPGRPRWSEMELWLTTGGTYILVKAGRSLVFHGTREHAGPHAKELRGARAREAASAGIPCNRCFGPTDDTSHIFRENDLVTVIVSKSAQGVVESAHLVDEDKIVFLPNLAHALLREASAKDESIRAAYNVEVVV